MKITFDPSLQQAKRLVRALNRAAEVLYNDAASRDDNLDDEEQRELVREAEAGAEVLEAFARELSASVEAVAYEWTVQVRIHPRWVADGFDLDEERLEDILAHTLPYAHSGEYEGKVLTAPDPNQIRAEQGFKVEGYAPLYDEEG